MNGRENANSSEQFSGPSKPKHQLASEDAPTVLPILSPNPIVLCYVLFYSYSH